MKKSFLIFLAFVLLAFSLTACGKEEEKTETTAETTTAAPQTEAAVKETEAAPEAAEPVPEAGWKVGVGSVDITPDEPVQTVGGVEAVDVTEQDTPLMVKAAVIQAGDDKAVIVTIDTLKYPYHEEAVRKIAALGYPKENILISASHTHSAPYYTYYFDNLENEILDAVKAAEADLEPVTLGAASTKVSGVSGNRRLVDADGSAWNVWLAPDSVREACPNPGPLDEEMALLTATKADGKVKAVIWNFADHPCSYSEAKLSADFPGHVQENVNGLLGYDAMTLFINGAAGDINPTASTDTISDKMAEALVKAAKSSEPIETAKITGFQEKLTIKDRKAEFAEEDIAKKWPDQLENYRSNYENTKKKDPNNDVYVNAVAFGDGLVIASEPGELFAQYGLDVKEASSFPVTMIAEATNGFMGYIPTPEDFEEKGYETWYGEHSFLDEGAGDQIARTMKDLVKKAAKENGVATLVSGLKMEVHKLVDTTNVIVRFNKEAYGCTEKENFTVTDADGREYPVTAAASAFAELGGEVPNVFKLSFAKELPEGEYTVKAENLFANTSDTSPVYKACEASFTIGEGTAKGKAVSGDVAVSFVKTPNNKSVIVRFSQPVDGCTDAENYQIKDKSGKAYTVTKAESAFVELGGEIPDVFKVTASEQMPDGAYVMTIRGLTGSSGEVGELTLEYNMGGAAGAKADLQALIAASFPSTTATMGLVKVNDKANVIVGYSTPLEGCTEANQYMIVDANGMSYAIRSAKSAFAELGGEIPDVFRVTTDEELPVGKYTVYSFGMLKGTTPVGYMTAAFEITEKTAAAKTGPVVITAEPFKYIDRSNIIIKFSEEVAGFTDAQNYTVVGEDGTAYKPREVTSAFARTGGTDPNVFNMNFATGLPNGKYVLTVTGLMDGSFEVAPVTTAFPVPGDVEFLAGNNSGSGGGSGGSGGGGGSSYLTGLGFQIVGTPGSTSVIVRFDREVQGSTDAGNYTLVDSEGTSYKIRSAVSAFAATGLTNSFRITFRNELDPGSYIITASNQKLNGGTYRPVSAGFTLEDTTLNPSTAWMRFSTPLADGNYSVTLSNLQENGQTLAPIVVNFTVGDAADLNLSSQGLSRLSAALAPLEVTAEVIDRSNILIKLNRSPKGVTSVSNYVFRNTDTQQTVSAPAMSFVEPEVLRMGIYKVVDSKNVIVRFNMDMNGATENENYVVTNEAGQVMAISKVTSAFQELGGEATNVFKISFVNELPAGRYSVLARNLSKDGKVLAPVSKEFTIGGAGEEKLKGLTLSVYSVVDSRHVIVRFNKAADGATDVNNYTVRNTAGEEQEIVTVTSAFAELGGTVPNVFKITFRNALADGNYKVYAKNQFNSTEMKAYETVSASFKYGDVEDVYLVGVGDADITPEGNVPLAGDTSSTPSTGKDTNLYVKAAVIDSGLDRVVFVTIDTLKFPEQDVAIAAVAALADVPEENVYITASHTHSAPIYSYYYDNFVESITEAVTEALSDMEPCALAVASAQTSGLTQNRRYLDNDGQVWNEWFAPASVKALNQKTGPEDEEIEILAAIDEAGDYKAILWNFACHACANLSSTISADYPGHVQTRVSELLGYNAMTLYMTGAAGDVNPDLSRTSMTGMGNTIGSAIVTALGDKKIIEHVNISSSKTSVTVSKRNASFAEAEITKVWPAQLEHYRNEFNTMKKAEKESYSLPVSAVCIGSEFVLSANSAELFCALGKNIKELTPAEHVMIAEATNAFSGYVPTAEDYEYGGYETWYGSHSYLEEEAGEKIRVACLGRISAATGIEIDPYVRTGLELTVYKVEDGNHVVVQFNKEVDGCTEVGNYTVKDSRGNSYAVTGAESAWTSYHVPNSFRLTLAKDLPGGEITVTARNMYKGTDTYTPASAGFELMELSVYSVPDDSSIIVQFPREAEGCTTAANYVVKNEAGAVQTVTAAESAFVEIGGAAPNVFKLTFGEPLEAGKYNVYAKNIIDGGKMVVTGAAEFMEEGILQDGLTANVSHIEDRSNIVVQFNKAVDGFTESSNYVVTDKEGNKLTVASVDSAWTTYQEANSFRITLAEAPKNAGVYTITAKNMYDEHGKYKAAAASFGVLGFEVHSGSRDSVIVHMDRETAGATEAGNYSVLDSNNSAQTISSVASAFTELGGTIGNVFKITFAQPLAYDKYTIKVINQTVGGVPYAPASCEYELYQEGLTAKVTHIEDGKNIVVQFNKAVDGFTEAPNYSVTDPEGKELEVSSVESAWTTYEEANSFRITLGEAAEKEGQYRITASNMYNGDGKYAPAAADFGVLGFETHQIVDPQHVIVHFSLETVGATEKEFYSVRDADGNEQAISGVASAFTELGGTIGNVFKITFAQPLAAGAYTVTVRNQTVGGVLYAPAACEFAFYQEGLTANVTHIEDDKNIVVQFNKAVDGCTEASLYSVKDPDGNPVAVTGAESAWTTYQEANSFRITLGEAAEKEGQYRITASNMYDGGGKYAPATADFGVLGLETYKVVDSQHVIVHFSLETVGATEKEFYSVRDADGNEQAISSVASAFTEIGGAVPNVFKLTFSEELEAGAYTVTASGQTVGGVLYAPAFCEFETLQSGLTAGIYKVEDSQNVVVQFNKAVDGCTEASLYTVKDADGNEYAVTGAESAWTTYQEANSFRITLEDGLPEGEYTVTASGMYDKGGKYKDCSADFGVLSIETYEVTDDQHVIIQISLPTVGATEKEFYSVRDADGAEQTISSVASAFTEIGGAAPNVFKITFAQSLAEGVYTVHIKGQTAGGKKYSEAECTFEIPDPQLLSQQKSGIEVKSEKDPEGKEGKDSETEVPENGAASEEEKPETAIIPEEISVGGKEEDEEETASDVTEAAITAETAGEAEETAETEIPAEEVLPELEEL